MKELLLALGSGHGGGVVQGDGKAETEKGDSGTFGREWKLQLPARLGVF